MSTSPATVAKSRNTSAKSLNKGDATKATARELPKLVVAFREDKMTPNKAVNSFNKVTADLLGSTGVTSDQRLAAIDKAAEKAKADALRAIDRQVERARVLARMPRGTTGTGGIHMVDVCVEIFGGATRKTSVENNSRALGI